MKALDRTGEPDTHRRAGVRWVLATLAVLLILSGGIAILAVSFLPFPLRLAGWTLIGPSNREPVKFRNLQLVLRGSGGGRSTWNAKYYSLTRPLDPNGPLVILNRRQYRLGPLVLIGP